VYAKNVPVTHVHDEDDDEDDDDDDTTTRDSVTPLTPDNP
jgi:hypothetical protein